MLYRENKENKTLATSPFCTATEYTRLQLHPPTWCGSKSYSINQTVSKKFEQVFEFKF